MPSTATIQARRQYLDRAIDELLDSTYKPLTRAEKDSAVAMMDEFDELTAISKSEAQGQPIDRQPYIGCVPSREILAAQLQKYFQDVGYGRHYCPRLQRHGTIDKPLIAAYVTVFGRPTCHPFNGAYEIIQPHAFYQVLYNQTKPIELQINHDPALTLASTKRGTLAISEDAHGLVALADVHQSTHGEAAALAVKWGRLIGGSIALHPEPGRTYAPHGCVKRYKEIFSVESLPEISLTDSPAVAETVAVAACTPLAAINCTLPWPHDDPRGQKIDKLWKLVNRR